MGDGGCVDIVGRMVALSTEWARQVMALATAQLEAAMVGDGGGGMSGGSAPASAKRVQKAFAIRTAARRSDECSSKLQYVFSYCAFQKSDCCFHSSSSLAVPSNSMSRGRLLQSGLVRARRGLA